MQVTPIKTAKITPKTKNIFQVLDKFLPKIKEKSILAVTSKIIAIAEGRVVKMEAADKDKLIRKESQYYLEREDNPYNVSLTITRNNLVATAGIDESNGGGYYVLWPKDPQKSASDIRRYLKKRFGLKKVGVIVTDSKTAPMRWGVTAIAISYSGFIPLKNYIGKPDLFGRKFQFEKMSIIDNLASAAAVVMGEGSEQTPMALIENIGFVKFQEADPTQEELDELKITIEEDIYAPFLKSVKWKKGQSS